MVCPGAGLSRGTTPLQPRFSAAAPGSGSGPRGGGSPPGHGAGARLGSAPRPPAASAAADRREVSRGQAGPPPGRPGGRERSEGPPRGRSSLPALQAPVCQTPGAVVHPLAARGSRHRCPRSLPSPQPERRHGRAVRELRRGTSAPSKPQQRGRGRPGVLSRAGRGAVLPLLLPSPCSPRPPAPPLVLAAAAVSSRSSR